MVASVGVGGRRSLDAIVRGAHASKIAKRGAAWQLALFSTLLFWHRYECGLLEGEFCEMLRAIGRG